MYRLKRNLCLLCSENLIVDGVRVAHLFHFCLFVYLLFTFPSSSCVVDAQCCHWLLITSTVLWRFFIYKTRSRKYSLAWFRFLVPNATFSNISAISWQPVLVVEKDGVPEEPPTMGKQLENFITSGYESSASVLLFTKQCTNPRPIGDRLVWVFR
jgi:hypothetical protein